MSVGELPLLERGHHLDGENSFYGYAPPSRRAEEEDLLLWRMGVSGGEKGAPQRSRHRLGGDRLNRASISRKIAARAGEPCCTYIGKGDGTGIMSRWCCGQYADHAAHRRTYISHPDMWPLQCASARSSTRGTASFGRLSHRTSLRVDAETGCGARRRNHCRPCAGQKGTGRWTVLEHSRACRSPPISAACNARDSRTSRRSAHTQARYDGTEGLL